jgi:tetratricopeptide (TPR) repeat protein
MRKIMELKEERLEKIAQLDQKQLEKLAALDRARFERLANKSVDDIEKELSHIRIEKVKKEDAFRKREVSEKRIKEADDIYRESLKLYDEDLEALKEQRKAWKSAVKEGDEEDAIKHAKEYLTSAADLVIDSLEKVRARVVANDDLTEADAKAILAEIDERVAAMEDAKETVADAKTKEEVKAAGKEVMAAWEHSRLKLKIHAEKVAAASVGEIISRSEQLEKRLDIILAEMESNGTVVDDLDEKVDDFSDLVDDARAKYAQAQEYLEQAKAEEDSTLFEKAKTLVRDAHDDLKEANVILMEIVREVKQEGGSLEDDEDDDSVDVIVEDDDDDGSEDESDDEGNTTQA